MHIYDEKNNRWITHRDTAEYKRRKLMLRDCWTLGLVSILPLAPAIQITLIMLAIFVSFSVLDETPYQSSQLSNQR